MDGRTFLFGMIMLLLAPLLWPVAMLMPDRERTEAGAEEREERCRELILVACEQGDLEWAVELAAYWTGIDPAASGPREIGIIAHSTLSRERKLEAVARVASRDLRPSNRAP